MVARREPGATAAGADCARRRPRRRRPTEESPMGAANEEQGRYWQEAAAGWLRAEQHTARVGLRFAPLAIDALDLQPGQRVLDIGCGSGPTTLELARRVAPGGEAVGADIAPAMIEAA